MTISHFQGSRTALRVTAVAIAWLVLISGLHAHFNGYQESKEKVLMGYMPVVTNLAAPLIDEASKDQALHFQALKFASFAEMSEAFRSGHIQVAFIIAPLAIVLHQQGVPLKVVYIGNRHESTLVVRKDLPGSGLSALLGKTVAVPIRYSGHSLAMKRFMRKHGLAEDAIRLEEIPPPDMPSALAAGGIDGFFVGEPFASKVLRSGLARRLTDVEDMWPGFICNLMIVRRDLVESRPRVVRGLVSAAAKSGVWAQNHLEEAVRIVSLHWGQDAEFVRYVFENPPRRFRFDLYRPDVEELEEIALEMRHAGLVTGPVNVRDLVEGQFASMVETASVSSLQDILKE